jgi:deoxyribodipyrimidine photo-lyase
MIDRGVPAIVWFRQDLRLCDNPALAHAAQSGRPLICLYVLDDETPGPWRWGGASRWWLHHSLLSLGRALRACGGSLILRTGHGETILRNLAAQTGARTVVWNRCYEPFAVARDKILKGALAETGIEAQSFNACLLYEPWEIRTGEGTPFRVFTPFWNALRAKGEPDRPRPAAQKLSFLQGVECETLKDWRLLPTGANWAKDFPWTPGEDAAHQALDRFIDRVDNYRRDRDLPAEPGTSRLSPHLHWGEISPRQIWHAIRARPHNDGSDAFLRELGWREFCHQLLFYHPTLPDQPLQARFAEFAWRNEPHDFRAWTRGETGIPIVDAGMRQLWQTGWMHNRVRMIAASVLVKQLGIHWRQGEAWFWDTLVDADLANNAAGWQWVAGTGADAAPFFRIFNPVLQGAKFDPKGDYVRAFVPELKHLADRFIHKPWEAPAPPGNYPKPIVDLGQGRKRALAAFQALKG